jgi:hypothetical protein
MEVGSMFRDFTTDEGYIVFITTKAPFRELKFLLINLKYSFMKGCVFISSDDGLSQMCLNAASGLKLCTG